MVQEITTTLPTEEFLSASGFEGSASMEDPFSKKKQRSWIPSVERMPPIVQFVMHIARWCRSKSVAGRKEGAPLRLVGQLTLGAKRHLALVEVGGMQFLVGGGTEHVTVIVPVPAAVDVQAANVCNAANADSERLQ